MCLKYDPWKKKLFLSVKKQRKNCEEQPNGSRQNLTKKDSVKVLLLLKLKNLNGTQKVKELYSRKAVTLRKQSAPISWQHVLCLLPIRDVSRNV